MARLEASLRFRVELGSYRQGDKRFVIKASLSEGRGPEARPARASIGLIAQTPVSVASKVKRSRMAAHRQQQQQHDDDDASVSPMPPARARLQSQLVGPTAAAPRMRSLTAVDLSQLQARLDGLEELLVERVLPISRTEVLDGRLAATSTPNNDEELPATHGSLAVARPRADVVRRRRGHGPGHGRGQGRRGRCPSRCRVSGTPPRRAAAASAPPIVPALRVRVPARATAPWAAQPVCLC